MPDTREGFTFEKCHARNVREGLHPGFPTDPEGPARRTEMARLAVEYSGERALSPEYIRLLDELFWPSGRPHA